MFSLRREGGESGFPPKQNTRARTKSRQLHTLFGLCNLDIIWIFYEQYPYVICIYSYLFFFSNVAWTGGLRMVWDTVFDKF